MVTTNFLSFGVDSIESWNSTGLCWYINNINPLSPNINIQILQTDLHTFPLRISWKNLIKHQGIFSFMIIFYILTTLSLDNVWILLGENRCWSLLGLKGLTHHGFMCCIQVGAMSQPSVSGFTAGAANTSMYKVRVPRWGTYNVAYLKFWSKCSVGWG